MFNKDLLLFDVEATGLDARKHEMIEIAAILLDKKTLKAKQQFSSFIKPTKWAGRSKAAMAVNKISWEQLKEAPSLKTVMRNFQKEFSPKNVILAYYGGNVDIPFLKQAYEKCGMRYDYDYHTFDVWGLFYTYMALHKKLTVRQKFTGLTLESTANHFKIPVPKDRHDAAADCILEAAVLRQVIKGLKK